MEEKKGMKIGFCILLFCSTMVFTTLNEIGATAQNISSNQSQFGAIIGAFAGEYKSATNELKKSAVRAARKLAIQKALSGSLDIVNWIGTLKEMGTTSKRNAYVSIQPDGSKFRLQTWNNELSDLAGNTLISQGSELYKKVADLDKGVKVIFNGRFVPGDDDFVQEQSVTEGGAMTDPEFTVIFTSIDVYQKGSKKSGDGDDGAKQKEPKVSDTNDGATVPLSSQTAKEQKAKAVEAKQPAAVKSVIKPILCDGDTYIVESIPLDNPQRGYVTERRIVSVSSDKVIMTSRNVASKTKSVRTLEFTPE